MTPTPFLSRWRRRSQARRASGRQFAFCTIATRDFVPWAMVLFESIRRFHPAARLLLLYVHGRDEEPRVPVLENVEVISVRALVNQDEEITLRRRYNVPEFCFALKPRLLAYALDKLGDRAVYFDSDIDVHGPLEEAAIALESACAVLTPHLDTPITMDARRPSDMTILRAGACNLGFVAVAECEETRHLLAWWGGRVGRWGFVLPEAGYQGDQKWMDLAPSLFPGVTLLRDPGYNVAYWNLHSRYVTREEGALVVKRAGGVLAESQHPLVFVHFSGFDPDAPEVLSRYQNRIQPSDQPALMELARDFAHRIVEARRRVAALEWRAVEGLKQEPNAGAAAIEGPMGDDAYHATLSVGPPEGSIETIEETMMRVSVTNSSPVTWLVAALPDGTGGISLTYHLRDRNRDVFNWDNPRYPLPHDMAPGESIEIVVGVKAPFKPGFYFVEFDLVHENVAWFADRGNPTAWSEIHVGGIFETPA